MAPAPGELWVVIGLLAVAGGLMLYQTTPQLSDVVEFTLDLKAYESLAPFYIAYLLELALLGVAMPALAYGLSRRHPSARLTATAVCGALAISYLLQDRRSGTETWELSLVLVVTAMLALGPATRRWFAAVAVESQPAPLMAAWSMSRVMAVALGLLGVSLLAATSQDGSFGLIGAGLILGGIVTLRSLRNVPAGDRRARMLLSGVMAGDIVLLVLARSEVPAAEALVVPITVAAAVVVLLWLPAPERAPMAAPEPVPEPAPEPAPAPQPEPVPEPAPAPRLPPVVSQPAPAPAPPAYYAVVSVTASKMAKSSPLGLLYDQESWFPTPAPGEHLIGAYLVLVLLHGDGGPGDREFEGTSSLVITDRRLAGVCPRGTGRHGHLDSTRGPVIPWAIPIDQLSEATTATSQSGTYVSMGLAGHGRSRILFAKPRAVQDGSFVTVDMSDLASALSRALPPPGTPH